MEGFAAEGLTGGDVCTKIPEIFDHFDVVVNFWPKGVFEPFGCYLCASEVVAFVWRNPGTHCLQVGVGEV